MNFKHWILVALLLGVNSVFAQQAAAQGPCFNITQVDCGDLVTTPAFPCAGKYCTYKEWWIDGVSQGHKWFCESSDLTEGTEIVNANVGQVDIINGGSGRQFLGSGDSQDCLIKNRCLCEQKDANSPEFFCGIDDDVNAVPLKSFNNAVNGGPIPVNCAAGFGGGPGGGP